MNNMGLSMASFYLAIICLSACSRTDESNKTAVNTNDDAKLSTVKPQNNEKKEKNLDAIIEEISKGMAVDRNLTLLKGMGRSAQPAMPVLMDLLSDLTLHPSSEKQDDVKEFIRIGNVLEILGKLNLTDKDLENLAQLVGKNIYYSKDVDAILVKHGGKGLPHLFGLLKSNEMIIYSRAAQSLCDMAGKDARIVDMLLEFVIFSDMALEIQKISVGRTLLKLQEKVCIRVFPIIENRERIERIDESGKLSLADFLAGSESLSIDVIIRLLERRDISFKQYEVCSIALMRMNKENEKAIKTLKNLLLSTDDQIMKNSIGINLIKMARKFKNQYEGIEKTFMSIEDEELKKELLLLLKR